MKVPTLGSQGRGFLCPPNPVCSLDFLTDPTAGFFAHPEPSGRVPQTLKFIYGSPIKGHYKMALLQISKPGAPAPGLPECLPCLGGCKGAQMELGRRVFVTFNWRVQPRPKCPFPTCKGHVRMLLLRL